MYILTKGLDKLDARVSGKEQRCIHTDSWDTIIRYARTNPWVYKECMKNGCTKSVELRFPAGSKLYSTEADDYTSVVTANSDGSHTVKYAVSIYGIRQDKDRAGNPIGLTFGPATGENYTNGYKCHMESGLKVKGTGDGASVLYFSINTNYQVWNNSLGPNASNGGWPGSRIRSTLNGADRYTANGPYADIGGGKIYYVSDAFKDNAGAFVLTESEALISAFPAELQDAIVPRAVISDTKYDDCDCPAYMFTTYDKLWLFSGAEVYRDVGWNNNVIRPHEGIRCTALPYDRAKELGISTDGIGYCGNIGYKESGVAGWWWLRSLPQAESNAAFGVCSDGDWIHSKVGNECGLTPGFCIGL